jgi:hypothetical protein
MKSARYKYSISSQAGCGKNLYSSDRFESYTSAIRNLRPTWNNSVRASYSTLDRLEIAPYEIPIRNPDRLEIALRAALRNPYFRMSSTPIPV